MGCRAQLSLHSNRIHIGGQNALLGIFTDVPNTRSCVISVLNQEYLLMSRIHGYV